MARRLVWLTALLVLAVLTSTSHGQRPTQPASPPLPNPQLPPADDSTESKSPRSATAFVMDVSGSMNDKWSGGRKIDSAKDALRVVTRLIRHDVTTLNVPHLYAIVTFTTDADVPLSLTGAFDETDAVIDAMAPQETTNIGAGLQHGLEEVHKEQNIPERLLVLLSDGMTNEGLKEDEVLTGPVAEARVENIPVYVCGYGDPTDTSSMNAKFLKQIASETGGSYYHASSGAELEDIYICIRHESLGDILADLVGTIAQDETKQESPLQVAANTDELHVTLNWPGSWLDLKLRDPMGREVGDGYPGVSIFTDAKPVYIIIKDPKPGAWEIGIYGRDVPYGQTQYRLLASARKRPVPTGGGAPIVLPAEQVLRPSPSGLMWPAIIVWVLCVLVGAATIIILLRGIGGVSGPPTFLIVTTQAGEQMLPIKKNTIHLGRSPECDVVISDPAVSGIHATLARTPEGFLLTDQGSVNGTILNDQRLTVPTPIASDDVIRLGNTELRFLSQQ